MQEMSGTVTRPQIVYDHKQQYRRFSTCPEPKHLSPEHPTCGTMVVKRTPYEALNSLLLRAGDVERNPGHTQPCYASGGATTTKGLRCVTCGDQCHKKCSSLTRNEAAQCQWLNSFICNHCKSSAGDQERCSVCEKSFRLRQY